MTKALDLDAIKAKAKPKTLKIDLPENIGFVYGRQWSLRESDELTALSKKLALSEGEEKDSLDREWRDLVIKYGICNEAGVPVFDNDTVDALYELPASVVDCMVNGAMKANGIDLEALAQQDEEEEQHSKN